MDQCGLLSLEPAPGSHPFCFSSVVAQRLQRFLRCQVGFKGDRVKPLVALNKKAALADGSESSWELAFDRIGETGFEPAASCSQSKRATKLRHSPNTEIIVLNGLRALARVLGSGHTRAIRAK